MNSNFETSFFLHKLYFLKSPFERTSEENQEICRILVSFEEFMRMFPMSVKHNLHLLQELCGYAQLETVNAKSTPGFTFSQKTFLIISINSYLN